MKAGGNERGGRTQEQEEAMTSLVLGKPIRYGSEACRRRAFGEGLWQLTSGVVFLELVE